MFADIGQYLWDLVDNWAAFMTGGIAAALVLIIERLRSRQVPARTFIVFLVFGFIAASFQTWRHEYIARIAAERVTPLPKDRSATLTQLKIFYDEASNYYRRSIQLDSNDTEFANLQNQFHAWVNSTGNWIAKNMGSSAWSRFVEPLTTPLTFRVKPEHNDLVAQVTVLRINLKAMVENPSWDK